MSKIWSRKNNFKIPRAPLDTCQPELGSSNSEGARGTVSALQCL